MSAKYDEIINLPHHVSKTRPQMPMSDRAAQFAPFAALTGYDSAIKEAGRLTDEKIELDEETLTVLDRKFVEDGSCVLENMMLAAASLGLGSVWVHREREIFDSEMGKALLREWGLPETLRGVGSIALGYPDGAPAEAAKRKDSYIVRV